MIIQRAITTDTNTASHNAVQEAMHILSERKLAYRWVCEVCGMVHTGSVPGACDSCGSSNSLVQDQVFPREMNSRW